MTDCNHELEYYYTMDELLPYGNITSTAVFRCTKCNHIFLEGELDEVMEKLKEKQDVKETD